MAVQLDNVKGKLFLFKRNAINTVSYGFNALNLKNSDVKVDQMKVSLVKWIVRLKLNVFRQRQGPMIRVNRRGHHE